MSNSNMYTRVKRPYFYLDGDTGSRKSTEVFKHIIRNSKFRNQILVTNKTDLLDQAEKALRKRGAENIYKFHTYDEYSRNAPVMKSVNEWFKNYCSDNSPNGIYGAPSILLCTEHAIKNASTLMTINGKKISKELTRAMKTQADLWIDELPEVHESHRVKVHNSPNIIKDWIELDYKYKDCTTFLPVWNDDGSPKLNKQGDQVRTEIKDSMWAVRPKSKSALKTELETTGQTYGDDDHALLSSVLNSNQDVYIRKSRWDGIGTRVHKRSDVDRGETVFQSFLNRKLFIGWNNITVISADYTYSFFADWMNDNQNFQLNLHRWIKPDLLNGGVHPISWSERARIVHCFDRETNQKNSKRYQQHHSLALCSKIYRELKKMGFPPFLLCTNNDRVRNHKLAKLEGCKLVSPKDMGSNEFQKYHVVVFDAALNHKPDTEADLKLFGVSKETILNHMVLNPIYQITSRTSLRDKDAADSKIPVTIFVMEESSALALAGRFASSNIGASVHIRHIDEDEYHLVSFGQSDKITETSGTDGIASTLVGSGQEDAAASPMRAARPRNDIDEDDCIPVTTGNCTESLYLENIVQLNGANPHEHGAVADCDAGSPSDGMMLTKPAPQLDQFAILPNKKSRNYETVESDLMGFVKYLKNTVADEVEDQESECARISRCIFKLGDKKIYSHAYFVPMVFSGGITPEAFNSVFNPERQNKAKGLIKHPYVIHNTFDRSEASPNEFQVWLFLDRPATYEQQYESVRRYVQNALESAGHALTGLQPTVEYYWAPCTNANNTGSAFFHPVNVDKARQVYDRYGVDPIKLLEKYPAD